MLDLQKKVLRNVAQNYETFRKELYKSIGWLNAEELTEFRHWVKKEFWDTHREIITEVLYNKQAV